MIKLRNMLITAIAIVGLSSSAWAGTTSIGIVGSMLDVEATGTETDKLTAAGANVADTSTRKKSTSADTFTGSLFAEFTSDTRWPMTFGFEYTPGTADISGKLSRSDTETSITGTTTQVSNTVVRTAQADATNFSTVYFEAPIWGMLYARAGVSNLDIDYVTTTDGSNGGNYSDNLSLSGTNYGVGLKSTTDSGMLWKLTYEESNYDTFTLNSKNNSVAANSNTIKGDASTSAIRFSLAKSF
jgi:hypothetical protein|tara:strand:+ start:488 stop:1213 length:726 start_codon:yes stop_codon:yes gene_type:complete